MPSTINASSSGSGGLISTGDASGVLQLQTNGTAGLTIDTSQRVGIGTSSPSVLLDVAGTGSGNANNWVFIKGGNTGGATFPGLAAGLAFGTNFSNGNSETNLVWGQTIGSQQYLSISKWASSTVTEQFRISSAGYVTTPYQPAFHVWKDNGDISNTSIVTAVFNNVYLNNGGHYSNSTGRFTAPVAGMYYFSFGFLCRNPTANRIYFYKNGSNIISGGSAPSQTYISAVGAGEVNQESSVIVSLAANDYVDIRVNNTAGDFYANSNVHNHFTGYLIG